MFYNVLLLHRHYPEKWRVNRTTLIPEPDKSINDVKNWRPITMSSLVSRIYSAMIDRRMRSATNGEERQKGFTRENGCYHNMELLGAAIQTAKDK